MASAVEDMSLCNLQNGTSDCGLYAIAFATAVAFGHDPGSCLFDQQKLRRHLYHCLNVGRLESFPHKSRLSRGVKCEDEFNIYCICRMPELKDVPMIECSKCTKWFHVYCVQVSDTVLNNSKSKWFCCSCS